MKVDGSLTLRYVVYDLLQDLQQTHSNAKITESSVLFWFFTVASRLKKLHIPKLQSGAYVTPFSVNVVDGGFDLPAPIFDYHLDRGLVYVMAIEDDEPIHFAHTYRAHIHRLYMREDERPSEENPYFYLESGRVTLLGLEPAEVEIGLHTDFSPTDMTAIDLDDPIDFPFDLYAVAKRQILDLATWALQVPRPLRSDKTEGQEVPPKKFLSVQDAVNPELEEE